MLKSIGPARAAGLLYLIVVLTGILSLAYIPFQLIDHDDAAQTISNISASLDLFRLGIAAGFVCYIAFLFLPLALYKLLAHVNQPIALIMVLLAIISVPISLGNMANKLDVLTLLSDNAYLLNMPEEQLQRWVMLSLARYNNVILVAEIFWGLWLLPFGYLVFKSNMLPRILGLFLMLGCFGYLIDIFGRTLFPDFPQGVIASDVTSPAAIGEIGTCLWLLLFGARASKPVDAQA